MATSELTRRGALGESHAQAAVHVPAEQVFTRVMSILASLRLTVALFALAIFLVFVGTLAQKDHDVWHVVRETYFRVWIAHVDLLAFERLAQMFFHGVDWNLSGGFYFPGGKLIGLGLLVNLFAAHAVRFKVAASGKRLVTGLAVIGVGVLLTALVIVSGMDQAVVSERSPAFYRTFWNVLRAGLAGLAFTGAYILLVGYGTRRSTTWYVLLAVDLAVGALAVWLLANPSFRIDDAGLRILWQLVQGTAAGGVLLAGCALVFRKRAGIVLLHAGVALLMVAELWTAVTDNEAQMTIPEGGTVNYSSDIRTAELAVIDGTHAGHDQVTVVPRSLLLANVGADARIVHGDLPFDVRVLRWLSNSELRAPQSGEANPATAGFGRRLIAVDAATATGVGDDAGRVDYPAAYVELFSKQTGDSLGTYLVSPWLEDQTIEADGRPYQLALRFKRNYYPFSLTLRDFRFDRYTGTDTPKNYSSLVQLRDPERKVEIEALIRMNNPLRYAAHTFYQADFDKATEKTTVLQVVANPGWMIPYVSCALVAVGMLAHFGVVLVRFLRRRAEELAAPIEQAAIPIRAASPWSLRAVWFPALIVAFFGVYLGSKMRMPHSPPSEAQVYEFAKLPLAYQGRIKPYDTVARNTLQILSGRQEVIGEPKPGWLARLFDVKQKTPAIDWLLETIAGTEKSRDARVFRIENLELLDTLGLKPRDGFRYSWNEIQSKPGEIQRQGALVREVDESERTLYQNKVADLIGKLNLYTLVVMSFQSPPISTDERQFNASLEQTRTMIEALRQNPSPHSVPPTEATGRWSPLMEAELQALVAQATNGPVNAATLDLSALLQSYAKGDATGFNKKLADYRKVLADYERSLAANAAQLHAAGLANAEILRQSRVDFEVFYNQFSPFYYAVVLYLVAFLLGVFSWIGWTEPLRRASIWLLVMTFALHTLALVGRIYISGRPPVTNLYSATVFVGWGGVLLSLVFEWIYRLGLGNIAAAVIGFLTLFVAHNLSLDGDTFLVLQAVLDTQFWLATHVVTINLGYGATVAAGLWGAMYVLLAHVFPVLDQDARRQLIRATYGTLCFAIFFSFVGTVLGGLWADDSWGRFWGWDPKENGALIIVLWNALVLHARWGGIVKNRGFATLAIGGNIAVAWSGFGVNEFGVGLHAYGASESSTAQWLLVFAVSQLVLIALGAMPAHWFERLGRPNAEPTS